MLDTVMKAGMKAEELSKKPSLSVDDDFTLAGSPFNTIADFS